MRWERQVTAAGAVELAVVEAFGVYSGTAL
jgi:hypothetical protein